MGQPARCSLSFYHCLYQLIKQLINYYPWRRRSRSILALYMMILSFIALPLVRPAGALPLRSLERMGDILEVLGPAYALGMASNEDSWQGVKQFASVMLLSQITVDSIKALKLEERPNGADYYSFPSGHTAAAFSAAMFVQKRYGWKKAVLPYIVASLTGMQRIMVKAHYPRDVATGILIASLVTDMVVSSYSNDHLHLVMGHNEIGLSYSLTF